MQAQPTLIWNTARGVWEKLGMVSLLCEHSELFSETWQTEGMMRNGQVFELPMQALLTTDSEFSSLPTPTTRDYKDGSEPHERDGVVQTDTVARAVFNSGEVRLPTPTTNGNDRKGPNYSSAGILQELEIANGILPKEYKDWEHAKEKVKWAEPIEGQTKTNLDSETNWGKFQPAINRWEETLGRPAPLPTKADGKDGAHRLSSAFTEWMMGVPAGWITDVGLTRNEELKACGNGVVPQQAELALRVLLEGITLPRGGGQVNLPTPTVSDTFTDNLASSQQKPGSMHSVTLPQAVKWVASE